MNGLEQQVRRAMGGIERTVEAAGGSMKDGVQLFIFRARPRMGDIGKASFVVAETFKRCNVEPTTTKLAMLEPGKPEQRVEIQAFAVIDWAPRFRHERGSGSRRGEPCRGVTPPGARRVP